MTSIPVITLPDALLTPEFALVRACCYLDERGWAEQHARILAELQRAPEPQRVADLARQQRVVILVHQVLGRAAPEHPLAQAIRELLHGSVRQLRFYNLSLHGELLRLQRRFKDAGLRMQALKGSLLSERLYGDHGLRQMRDIDILVQPGDVQATLQLLRAEGYEPEIPQALSQGHHLQLIRQVAWHFECRNIKTGALLELHWRLEHISHSRVSAAWARWLQQPDSPQSSHYELLYLCMHGSGHGWQSLRWLADVRILFSRLDFEREWQPLLQLAEPLRLQRILAESLLLVHCLCDWPLPPAARLLIEQQGPSLITQAHNCLEIMAGRPQHAHMDHAQGLGDLWHLLARWNDRHSFGERLRHALLILSLSQTDISRLRLPLALVWLYPLLRPFSLAGRYLAPRLRSKPP